ncbi:hypothetical protein [Schlesneria sp. T3-172]|uniref:hypothetical protein n=1 Tax=Schlesneria sphaerica TaxID=3373610 RepID=UPI0037C558FC
MRLIMQLPQAASTPPLRNEQQHEQSILELDPLGLGELRELEELDELPQHGALQGVV